MQKKGITAYRLSKETGIDECTIATWKNGRNNPSLESIKKLAKYFNKPIEYFL